MLECARNNESVWKSAIIDEGKQLESIAKWLNFGKNLFDQIQTGENVYCGHMSSMNNRSRSKISFNNFESNSTK